MNGFKVYYLQIVTVLFFLFFSTNSTALPFVITPARALPSSVNAGSTVLAYYNVINLANTKVAAFVKYLPPNVQQIAQDPNVTNLCGSPLSLAANANCTLELKINGPVNGSDANPQHHLFICLQSGVLCAGTDYPLNVSSASTVPPPPPIATPYAIATGYYFISSDQFPFVLASTDAGSTWNYTVTVETPGVIPLDTAGAAILQDSACTGTFCISGGAYFNTSSMLLPYAISSNTSGQTWQVAISSQSSFLPGDYSTGGFLSVDGCSTNFCITAGSYTNTSSVNYPFIAETNTSSWSFPYTSQSSALPSDFVSAGQFNSVSCSAGFCLAAGMYTNSSEPYPLVVKSTNGTSWSLAVSSTTGSLPGDFKNVYSSVPSTGPSISCQNNICVLAMTYVATSSSAPGPLAMVSQDGANTWSTVVNRSLANYPSDFNTLGGLNTEACSTTICIAAGYYIGTGSNVYPLIYESQQGGAWTIAVSSTVGPAYPAGATQVLIKQTACTGNHCIAAGILNQNTLLIAVTADGGNTWTYAPAPGNPPTDLAFTDTVASIKCTGLICLLGGYYQNTSGPQFPYVLKSINGGETWTYVVTSQMPPLPNGAGAVILGGVASSSSSFLVSSFHQFMRQNLKT